MKSKPKISAAKKKPAAPQAEPKDTPARKIVLVQMITVGTSTHWVALCDDGTLWAGLPGNWGKVNVDMIIHDPPPAPPPEPAP